MKAAEEEEAPHTEETMRNKRFLKQKMKRKSLLLKKSCLLAKHNHKMNSLNQKKFKRKKKLLKEL